MALRPWGVLDRGKRAVEPQGRDALRICSGEHQAHRATFRPAVDSGPFGAGRVHHGAHVTDSFFEGLLGDTIGESLATLVEDNDSSEGGQPFAQVLKGRSFPRHLEMRECARDEDHVARPVAKDPVRDMNAVTLGVLDCGFHHTFPSGT